MRDDDIVKHAIATYGFLIPNGEQRSAAEFGELIRKYSSHHRCQIIAERIEKSGLTFAHEKDGTVSASIDPEMYQGIGSHRC